MSPVNYNALAQMLLGSSPVQQAASAIPYTKRDPSMMGATEGAMPRVGGGTVRAYHGTTSQPFERFNPGKDVYMTPDKSVAQRYTGRPGQGRTIPLDVNLTNAARVDYSKINRGSTKFDPKEMQRAIDAARKHKKDFLIVENISDLGGPQTQIIALNPAGKVKNALTGKTMFGMGGGGLLGLLQDFGERKEPQPPM